MKPSETKSVSSSSNSDNSETQMQNIVRDDGLESTSSSGDSNIFSSRSSTVTTVAPANLQQEFSININIPNVQILKVNDLNARFY